MKLTNQLLNKHGDTLDDKSLTICSGTDYINVNYQHLVCPDAATAKVKALLIFLNKFFNYLNLQIKKKRFNIFCSFSLNCVCNTCCYL